MADGIRAIIATRIVSQNVLSPKTMILGLFGQDGQNNDILLFHKLNLWQERITHQPQALEFPTLHNRFKLGLGDRLDRKIRR